MKRIRPSLHYGTFIEHAQCLKFAADENVRLFYKYAPIFKNEDDRKRSLGLYNSSLLLFALSIENILKARALFIEYKNIELGKIKTFSDFLKKWSRGTNGHDLNKIIEFYKIKTTDEEMMIINELGPYVTWSGRFAYPRDETLTKIFESGKGSRGILNLHYIVQIDKFILHQIEEMKINNAL